MKFTDKKNPKRTSPRELAVVTLAATALVANSVLPFVGFQTESAYGTFAVAIIATVSLVMTKPIFSVSMLYILLLGVTAFAAGIGIESGGFLVETGVTGQFNGSFSRLLIFYAIFVLCALGGFRAVFDTKSKTVAMASSSPPLLSVGCVALGMSITLITLAAGIAAGMANGFSFLEGVNRYNTRNANASGIGELLFNVFLNNETFVALFLGTALTSPKWPLRLLSVACILFYLILAVMHGEQFMSVLHFCLTVIGPVIAFRAINESPVGRYVVIGSIAAVFIGGCSVFYAYQAQGYDAMQVIVSRLLLQGQVWYVVDAGSNIFSPPDAGGGAAFGRFLTSLFSWSTPAFDDYANVSGLRELMIAYGLPNVMNAYVADNVSFTMGQMAVPVFWFGLAGGAMFVACTGTVYGALSAWLIHVLRGGGVTALWLIAKVLSYATFALQQGEYWSLFGSRMWFYVLVALIWWFYVDARLPKIRLNGVRLS